jgi:predicted AlkP superfamily phosphohydrolase/phosphomutase/tetratricopeptide (TPR) repeat protein
VVPKHKILLVGWDSADWRLINPLVDAGMMPALSALIDRGAMGNLAAVEPVLSPLIWTSLATGKLPHKHGVLGFVEPDPLSGGVRNVGSTTRRCRAIWNILSEAGFKTHVVGWFAGHPAEPLSGMCVSERFPLPTSRDPTHWPLCEGSVTPAAAVPALAPLRVHPLEIEASQIQAFIPRAAELDQTTPAVQEKLRTIARVLAQTATLQAVTTWILENEEWDFLAVYFRALDELSHHFMPFHPPLLEGVDAQEAGIYAHVMEGAYAFHDFMLARLVELAGNDATVIVVSDHGFESGALRPGPVAHAQESMAAWHRPFGIIAMAGPGIAADERLYGSSVLDLTPTVLHLLDLPVGRDMDGKVLVSALADPGEIQRIDSWEGGSFPTAEATARNAAEEAAVLAQLAELGYIEPPTSDQAAMAKRAGHELRFNRLASLLAANLIAEAEAEARALAAEAPDERRFRLKEIQVLVWAGKTVEASRTLDALEATLGPCLASKRIRANLLSIGGQPAGARAHLEAAERESGPSSALHEHLGRLCLQQRHWRDAESRFRAALAFEPDSPTVLAALSSALARQDQNEAAVEAALAAVGLQHHFPAAHFQLGAVLAKIGFIDRAIQAFEVGLAMQPGHPLAHRYLGRLYRRIGKPTRAAEHESAAAKLTANSSNR